MPTALREVETTARERRRRTRTRAVSSLDTLSVSSLKPHEYDLRPTCLSLVCPSCRTWVPIHVAATSKAKAKLVAHHMDKAGTENPRRCLGSHRTVVLDVKVARWAQTLEEGVSETNGVRSNRVTRKPKTAVTPAVGQLAAQKRAGMPEDESGDGRPLWLLREMKWISTEPSVRDTDTRRAEQPAGDAPLSAPPVPLRTLRPERRAS
ncbi:hypothetical protein ABT354_34215 [Streptomyces sp. NPDC000594]|uniref:hypothetical protein n=1 Tax=unclassified Streptomyces TaxID=2593676 RepID=UPI0033212CF3